MKIINKLVSPATPAVAAKPAVYNKNYVLNETEAKFIAVGLGPFNSTSLRNHIELSMRFKAFRATVGDKGMEKLLDDLHEGLRQSFVGSGFSCLK